MKIGGTTKYNIDESIESFTNNVYYIMAQNQKYNFARLIEASLSSFIRRPIFVIFRTIKSQINK